MFIKKSDISLKKGYIMQINDHANKINPYILNTQKEEKESKENKNFIEFKFTQGVKELEKSVKDNQNNSESED